MTPLRIVIDTNAFRTGNFELLEKGPMLKLCRSGRIIPIYGSALIEETLNAYIIERKRDDLINRWLPFIIDTSGKRICKLLSTIWHEELVQERRTKTHIFMLQRDYQRLVAGISNIPNDGSWELWHSSQGERDIEKRKRVNMLETLKSMRKEVAGWRKAVNYRLKKLKLATLILI